MAPHGPTEVGCSTALGDPTCATPAATVGRIHVLTTEQHPDEHVTGIYHGAIVDGRLLRSDGTVVDDDLSDHSAAPPERLTEVFAGDTDNRAWTVDLHVDPQDRPYAVFSVRSPPSQNRYYYAALRRRPDGTSTSSPTPAKRCTAASPATPASRHSILTTQGGSSSPPMSTRQPATSSSAPPTADDTTRSSKG